MKRILAIILITALTISTMSISAMSVFATDSVDDGKVFSLDFSGLEAGAFAATGDIKNGVTDSAANITVLKYGEAPEAVTGPMVGSFIAQNGETVKYLTFANEEPTDSWVNSDMYYGGINLNKTLMDSMVADKQTMSVEFWVKRHANAEARSNGLRGSKGGHVFRYGTNATADGSDGTVQHINMEAYMFAGTGETNDGEIYMRPIGKYIKFSDGTKALSEGSEAVTLATNGEWDHYVYTKQITEDGNQVKYEAVVYKNGESIYTIDTSADAAYSDKTVIRQPDAGNLSFTIGGYSTKTTGGIPNADCRIDDIFDGAIAEFNIYDRALTATEVDTKFEEKEDVYRIPEQSELPDIVDDGKVFSLDFSNLEVGEFAAAGDVRNGVTGATENIAVLKYGEASEEVTGPKVGSFTSQNGDTVKYLTFANEEPTDSWVNSDMYYGGINLNKTLMDNMVADKQTMSVEFWVKRHANAEARSNGLRGSKGGHVFRYGTNSTADGSDGTVQHINMEAYMFAGTGETNDGNIYMRPVGKYIKFSDGTKVSSEGAENVTLATTGEWDHYVYTKQITETGSQVKYEAVVYKNGEAIYTIDTSTDEAYSGKTVIRQPDAGNLSFTIGGYSTKTTGGIPNADCRIDDIFDGAIAEFNIYDRALTATEVDTKFEEKEDVYRIPEQLILDVVSTKYDAISPLPGELKVEFSNDVDETSLNGKIMLYEGNNQIPGGVKLSVDDSESNVVKVKYGRLKDSTAYTVKVLRGIKSADKTATLLKDVSINVSTNAGVKYLDFDFEALDAGVIDATSEANYNKAVCGVITGSPEVSIVELKDENGEKNKVMQFGSVDGQGNITSKIGDYVWKKGINTAGNNFVYEIEYKEFGQNKTGARQMQWQKGNGNFNIMIDVRGVLTQPGPKDSYTTTLPRVYEESGIYNMTATNSFGLHSIKQTYVKDSTDNSYTIYTVNESDAKRKVLKSKTVNLNNPELLFIKQYVAVAGEGYLQIGKIKAYEISPLTILGEPTYNRTGKTLTFTLTDDVADNTYNNITVTNSYGNPVAATIGYQNRQVTITFKNAPSVNDIIYVSLDGVDSVNSGISSYKFNVCDYEGVVPYSPVVFTDQNGEVLNAFDADTTSVTATFSLFNTAGKAATPINCLAIYSGDELVKVVMAEAKPIASGKKEDFSFALDLTGLPKDFDFADSKIKLISLSDNNLAPVISSDEGVLLGRSL